MSCNTAISLRSPNDKTSNRTVRQLVSPYQKLLGFLYFDLSGAENPFFLLGCEDNTIGGSVGVCDALYCAPE